MPVFEVRPGIIETDMTAGLSDTVKAAYRTQIPLGRFGTAAEVAEVVCLLASPALPWMTGSIVLLDGGWSLPGPLVDPGEGGVRRRRRD